MNRSRLACAGSVDNDEFNPTFGPVILDVRPSCGTSIDANELIVISARTLYVEIDTGLGVGSFPRRALSAVLDWHKMHRDELMNNWNLARQELPLQAIDPLE